MFNRRLNSFRLFAKNMTENYTHFFVRDFNLAETRKKPLAEKGPHNLHKASMRWARVASPGALREEIKIYCQNNNAEFIIVDAKHTSRTCPFCENIVKVDIAGSIMVICDSCHEQFDQDIASATHILKFGMKESAKN